MTWRTIIVEKGGKLSLKQKQLLIAQDQQQFTVPLEDIAVIIIESPETVITAPLLSQLAIYQISLITCDEQHLPCGQWLPLGQYGSPLQTLKLQLNASEPLKKQIWARIVQQKIINQAFVLKELGLIPTQKRLLALAKDVRSGDRTACESQAAMIYFSQAFGKDFCRRTENNINAHLNYAYSVLRSAIARALVQYGWLPYLGLHHCNERNPFNLADDFIEPFRPLVDLKVWQLWQENKLDDGLTPNTKHQLARLLNYEMHFEEQHFTVLASIDRCVGAFKSTLSQQDAKLLKLPEMQSLKEHCYE